MDTQKKESPRHYTAVTISFLVAHDDEEVSEDQVRGEMSRLVESDASVLELLHETQPKCVDCGTREHTVKS